MTTVYTEDQRFSQWWLWVLILGMAGLIGYGFIQQVVLGTPFGDNPLSNIGLSIFSLVMLLFVLFFAGIRLRTRIDSQSIQMQFTPFLKREYKWTDIESAQIVNYGFVGYGIRIGSKHGIVYNVNGNKGLALKLKNGKKLVIGTQQPEQLQGFLAGRALA